MTVTSIENSSFSIEIATGFRLRLNNIFDIQPSNRTIKIKYIYVFKPFMLYSNFLFIRFYYI